MYEKEKRFQYKPLFDQKEKNTTILEAMLENYTETILKLEMPTTPSLTESKV
jgi:hypothetical protein